MHVTFHILYAPRQFSIDPIIVAGSAKYDLPADGVVEVIVPIDVPDGYSKDSLIQWASGSSRGVLVNTKFSKAGVVFTFASLGSDHRDRTATATVKCRKHQNSIDQAAYSHTVGSASPSAPGIAAGQIDVPDGYKCLGIVGLSSNHNYTVAFGRQDITSDGEYTITAKPDSNFSDLVVNFRVLMIRAQPPQQLPLLTHCALRHSYAR